jgi:hypothetical protein
MKRFNDAKILLIAPPFFGYAQEISQSLTQAGAIVDYLPDRPFEAPILKAITRLNRNLAIPFADKFYIESLEKIGKTDYTHVLVIIGEALSPKLLKYVRAQFLAAEFILYMWDSFKNKKALVENLKYFDRALTFDKEDAIIYGMQFRPLFFSSGFAPSKTDINSIDISFIGTAHSDRYKVIKSVRLGLGQDIKQYFYLYLQARWVFYAYRFGNPAFKGARVSEFEFTALGKAAVRNIFANSTAILDIEHPQQTGLTMRTFETLGSYKKLITTNLAIETYDFFSHKNIYIIQRDKPTAIPKNFFYEPYEPINKGLYEKYSINGWLADVFLIDGGYLS